MYRELERRFRLVVVALRRIKHREVVVRLRQLGKILGKAGEDLDRVLHALLFGEDESFQEASLRIARHRLQVDLDLVEGRLQLLLAVELLGFLEVVRRRCPRHRRRAEHDCKERRHEAAKHGDSVANSLQHRVIIC